MERAGRRAGRGGPRRGRGRSGCARARVRAYVRARTPPSLRPQSPGGTRQHPGLPRPPPTADSATSPPRQGPRLFPARRFRHSGSPSAPTPAARRPSNRKLLCPDRLREAAGPRRRSAAQAELWEGSRSGGRSLKMAEAGVNWGSPGRAQVSCFGGGTAGGRRWLSGRGERFRLGRCRLDTPPSRRWGGSRTRRWGLLGEGSRLHLRAGSARARRKQRAHGGAGFRGCRGPRTVGDLAEWKAAGGRRKGRPRRSVWGQRWASCLVYTLTGLGCLGGLGGRPGLVRERVRH